MMRTTPFHARTSALNQTGLWSHWAGFLAATRYHLSEKLEYFAIRNGAAMFDTSPLYKYRITGRDAQHFLSRVLVRDIRTARSGQAQYTMWCDDAGHVIEDGVIVCRSEREYLLSTAEPNLAYLRGLIGLDHVEIEDVSDEMATLAFQGPRSQRVLSLLVPQLGELRYFRALESTVDGAEVMISRTGFTGDLGYEIWVRAEDALPVWDAIAEAGEGHGVLPVGLTALKMARIEAGLLLLDTDFSSARFAWTDADRSTPVELGFGRWFRTLAEDDRAFIGRKAIERELATGPRWCLSGLVIDWQSWNDLYRSNGLVPTKDHIPGDSQSSLYDDDGAQVGYVTSFMYSPMVQRHIAIARVRPELAEMGTEVNMEVTLNHQWQSVKAHVARLPFYDPAHRTT